jgi:predicted permease
MDALLADLRYAARNILRRPGFSALAVLTLAVGIGVNAVAFTAVNALLFHPLVFNGVDRLGWIMLASLGNPYGQLSYTELAELKRHARVFDAVSGQGRLPLAMMVDGRAEQIWTLFVSDDYFRALDTRAAAGRLIDRSDTARSDLVAVVSHQFWRTRLKGAPLAGRSIAIAGRTVSIVGVVSDGFQGPGGLYAPDVWLPLEKAAALGLPERLLDDDRWLGAFARLADGASAAQARTDLAALVAQLPPPRDPGDARERRLGYFPMRDGHPEVRGLAPYVWIAMAIVGLVLLIACFNVAALLLARAAERRREIGIRTALGAGRARIVRQLVTEGLVLAVLSGLAALALAAWSGRLLEVFSLPAPIPQRLNLQIDARLIAFTGLMVLIAGILPALLPALHATRRNLVSSMRIGASGEGRRSRARSAFVTAQIAGSTLFLATSLLFVRSFWNASDIDLGFDTNRLVVAQLAPATHGVEGPRAEAFAREVAARLNTVPGLTVALTDRAPFSVGFPRTAPVSTATFECVPPQCKPTVFHTAGPRYFEALGLPLRAGREFDERDLQTRRAIVVNETMARRLWPGQSPLGQPVKIGAARTPAEVVGVVGDIAPGYMGRPPEPLFYQPMASADFNAFALVVRTSGSEGAAIATIRDVVHAVAPALPFASIEPMNEKLKLQLWPRRTAAGFLVICGSLALLLATVGLFGVTYFTVRQRTREFGIRVALGARPADVIRQVMTEGVTLAVPGAAAGLLLAIAAGRLTSRMLLGVSPADPVSFAATAAIELAVALAACALPARRATQADPMLALRDDN